MAAARRMEVTSVLVLDQTSESCSQSAELALQAKNDGKRVIVIDACICSKLLHKVHKAGFQKIETCYDIDRRPDPPSVPDNELPDHGYLFRPRAVEVTRFGGEAPRFFYGNISAEKFAESLRCHVKRMSRHYDHCIISAPRSYPDMILLACEISSKVMLIDKDNDVETTAEWFNDDMVEQTVSPNLLQQTDRNQWLKDDQRNRSEGPPPQIRGGPSLRGYEGWKRR